MATSPVTCTGCGRAIDVEPGHAWGEGVVCEACFERLRAPPAISVVAYATPTQPKRTSGLGIASLVLGLVALPSVCIFSLAAVPLALVGAALGLVAMLIRKPHTSRAMPIAGLAVNGVTLLVCATIAIVVLTMTLMR